MVGLRLRLAQPTPCSSGRGAGDAGRSLGDRSAGPQAIRLRLPPYLPERLKRLAAAEETSVDPLVTLAVAGDDRAPRHPGHHPGLFTDVLR
jgi:hypothetical protein